MDCPRYRSKGSREADCLVVVWRAPVIGHHYPAPDGGRTWARRRIGGHGAARASVVASETRPWGPREVGQDQHDRPRLSPMGDRS